jgi:hypothetical protein
MRSVSPVFRRGVALLVLTVLIGPMVLATDGVPTDPPPDPQARIGVPGGIVAETDPPTTWELFLIWLQAQIGVPIG